MSSYLLDERDVTELRRMRAKIDSLSGPGVHNDHDSIAIRRRRHAPDGGAAAAIGPAVRMFRVQSVDDDHLLCRIWDGTTLGDADIKVAKPPELRRTGIHGETLVLSGGTYSYVYSSAIARTVTDESDSSTEDQVIVPAYEAVYPLDIIFAVQGIFGGTDVTVGAAASNSVESVMWQDLNVAGRAWARATS